MMIRVWNQNLYKNYKDYKLLEYAGSLHVVSERVLQ